MLTLLLDLIGRLVQRVAQALLPHVLPEPLLGRDEVPLLQHAHAERSRRRGHGGASARLRPASSMRMQRETGVRTQKANMRNTGTSLERHTLTLAQNPCLRVSMLKTLAVQRASPSLGVSSNQAF